jgi:mono/diheme cytochrome c family protein
MVRFFMVAAFFIAAGSSAFAQTPVQRGDYLVNSILNCGSCHTPRGPAGAEKPFAGGNLFESPAFKVYSSNITPDKETGIGNWSAEQIKKAVMHGVRTNGATLAVMPSSYYAALTTTDADAIVAYLRSLKPVKNEVPTPEYKQVMKHEELPAQPARLSRKARRGFYLATVGHCMECHTPMEKGQSLVKTSLGTGGREFKGPWGVSTSRNITSDKEKGLGSWSDAEIRKAIGHGIRKDGEKLKPPMGFAAYAKMTDKDMNDLVAYLRTVPAKQ